VEKGNSTLSFSLFFFLSALYELWSPTVDSLIFFSFIKVYALDYLYQDYLIFLSINLHDLFFESLQFPTPETRGRISTSFRRNHFRDRLGGQALVMIGRWYSRQPLTNHKLRLSTQMIPEIVGPKACIPFPLISRTRNLNFSQSL